MTDAAFPAAARHREPCVKAALFPTRLLAIDVFRKGRRSDQLVACRAVTNLSRAANITPRCLAGTTSAARLAPAVITPRSRSAGNPAWPAQVSDTPVGGRTRMPKRTLVVVSDWGYWGEELLGPAEMLDDRGHKGLRRSGW